MNSKDNLQRALKKAFEDHKEPLHEAQWDRLSAELDQDKRKKRRFLPWFFFTFGALLLAVAIGFYMGQKTPTTALQVNKNNTLATQSQVAIEDTLNLKANPNNSNNQDTPASNTTSTNPSNTKSPQKSDNPTLGQMADAASPTQPSNSADPTTTASNGNKKGTKINTTSKSEHNKNVSSALVGGENAKGSKDVSPSKPITNTPISTGNAAIGNTGAAIKSTLAEGNKTGTENPANVPTPAVKGDGKDPNTSPSKPIATVVPKLDTTTKPVDPPSVASANDANNNDSTKPNGKKPGKKEDDPPSVRPRFAIGFSSGIGTTNFKVRTITNATKIHKDAEGLFNLTNANSKGQHFNFNFEWYPVQKWAIGFAAGLQYRSIVQTFDFKYKLNQVPIRDTNANISGYFFVPDTFALTFPLKGRNQLNYVNVPIRMMYTLPINAKNELLFSAGISTSFVTKANGQALSINTTQLSSLSSLYKNKVNVGWSLGLQYSYNVYKQWWLGSEFQYQQNKYNYSLDYGILRSKIKITNYNLAVRYKF